MELNSYLLEWTDKVAFLELEKELLGDFGKVPDDFVVPVFVEDIKDYAKKGEQHFSTKQICLAALYTLGLNPSFKYRREYMNFLTKAVERPELLAMSRAMERAEVNAYKDALIYMRAAKDIAKTHSEILLNYGLLCAQFSEEISDRQLKEELVKEASESFEKVLKIEPAEYVANFQLGLILVNKGEYEEALPHLRIAFEKGDGEIKEQARLLVEEIEALNSLTQAEFFIEAQAYEKAIKLLEEIRLDAANAQLKYQILFAKGFCYKATGNLSKAIDEYSKALAIHNQDTLLLADLGVCYAYEGDYEQSLEFYLAALDLDDHSPELLNNVSMVYLALDQIEKAKEYIGRAKELAPDDEIVNATILKIRKTEEGMI